MIARPVLTALMLSLSPIGAALAQSDPLPGIVAPKRGASACYRRAYPAAHLARLPRQQTTQALLSFRYENDKGDHAARIMLRQRSGAALIFAGSCVWNPESANIDTSGNRMVKSFRKTAGYDCIVLTAPSSAEEGGYFVVDLAAEGRSATLHIDSPIAAWNAPVKNGAREHIELGTDDRVFRLERTDPSACRALEEEAKDVL